MIIIGLTGSIGMGKSTAGAMFETLGVPVHESDDAVRELLAPGREGYLAVCAGFPYFEYPEIYGRKLKNGLRPLDKAQLAALVFSDPEKKQRLEAALHPLVRAAQNDFILKHRKMGARAAALDIPLLFETGAEQFVDYTINVTAPACVQRARVLARPGMNEDKFQAILESQMPDAEKSARADFILKTGQGRAHTMRQIKHILNVITRKHK